MERISVAPTSRFGKPCVADTRITVQGVLELVAADIACATIIEEYYPTDMREYPHACLCYSMTD